MTKNGPSGPSFEKWSHFWSLVDFSLDENHHTTRWTSMNTLVCQNRFKDGEKLRTRLGNNNYKYDNDNQTLQEEYIFELAGASIGLLSSLYHPIVAKCCVMKDDKKVEEDNLEEKNLSEQV